MEEFIVGKSERDQILKIIELEKEFKNRKAERDEIWKIIENEIKLLKCQKADADSESLEQINV